MQLTGEIGTGKTMMLDALVLGLDARTKVARLSHTTISEEELFELLVSEFGLEHRDESKLERLRRIQDFLDEWTAAGRNSVLVVDEAQNLSLPVLEEIRLLSNLRSQGKCSLQIVLSGQPEFRTRLDQDDLRQLKQRIGIRYHLTPLSARETGEYIAHRLRVAGADSSQIFDKGAVDAIFEYAGGVPRMINIICDRALVAGYGANRRRVSRALIDETVEDIEGAGLDAANGTVSEAPPDSYGVEPVPQPPRDGEPVAIESYPEPPRDVEPVVVESYPDSQRDVEPAVVESYPEPPRDVEPAVVEPAVEPQREVEPVAMEPGPELTREARSLRAEQTPRQPAGVRAERPDATAPAAQPREAPLEAARTGGRTGGAPSRARATRPSRTGSHTLRTSVAKKGVVGVSVQRKKVPAWAVPTLVVVAALAVTVLSGITTGWWGTLSNDITPPAAAVDQRAASGGDGEGTAASAATATAVEEPAETGADEARGGRTGDAAEVAADEPQAQGDEAASPEPAEEALRPLIDETTIVRQPREETLKSGPGGNYRAIVLSSRDNAAAAEEASRLATRGFSAEVMLAAIGDGDLWFRVAVKGGYPSLESAREVVKELRSLGYRGAWVHRE